MISQPFADPGVADLRSPWRFLRWLAGTQRRLVASGAVWGVAWMVAQAAIPALLGTAVDAVVRRDRDALVGWSLVLLALGVAQAVAGILRHRRAVNNFVTAATRVEQLLARAASRLGPRLTEDMAAGEVANLGAADVERIASLLDVSARFSGAVVSYLGVTVVLLLIAPTLGAVIAVGAVVAVVLVGPLIGPLERRQSLERDRRAAAASLAADTVVGLRILRGLGGEAVFAGRFAAASQDVRGAAVHTAEMQSFLDAAQVVLPQALVLAVTWIGAHLALHHHLTPGQLVAVYAYAAFLVLPVQTVVEASGFATAARVAAGRVLVVLRASDAVPVAAAPAGRPPDPRLDGPGAPGALVDPTTGLVVAAGRTTAVVTAAPEESAALADRLGRWVDPPPGWAVTLDGVALSALPVAEVRRRVMVVDREAVLLAGRLGELLDPPSRGDRVTLAAALAAAAADEIVASLPDGLDTRLPERGRSLSGGQRQRMILAQALVADPEILVLDEPTSAVDAHTEARIGAGVTALRVGRTTVIATTSPLLLAHADRVVLLDGHVVAEGTHAELLARSARYAGIVTRGAAVDDGPGDRERR
jgi:ABC-type multidrug transport system fused ATPase/permease subunit